MGLGFRASGLQKKIETDAGGVIFKVDSHEVLTHAHMHARA